MEKKFKNYIEYKSLNENVIADLKNKVDDYLNNFQNKETLYRRFYGILFKASTALVFAWAITVIYSILNIFIKTKAENTVFVISTLAFSLLTLLINKISNRLKKERAEVIQEKARELRNMYRDRTPYISYIYMVIGSKSDINNFLNRLTEDDLLSENYILITPEVTLIDFNGLLNNGQAKKLLNNKNKDLDPYGEEDWDNSRVLTENEIIMVFTAIKDIEREYKIILRSIMSAATPRDNSMFLGYNNITDRKDRKIDIDNYLYWKNRINRN
jgi:hypothetical protein